MVVTEVVTLDEQFRVVVMDLGCVVVVSGWLRRRQHY